MTKIKKVLVGNPIKDGYMKTNQNIIHQEIETM